MAHLSILLPVRNEGVNLKMALRIIQATMTDIPHELLVIYDSLDDDSIPIIENMRRGYPQLRSVHNTLGKGVTRALRAGIEQAQGDYIFILSADDMGPVLTVEDMVSLMDQGYDVVSSTRYSKGGRVLGGVVTGRFLSRMANKLFYLLFDTTLTDATVSMKMYRRSIFEKIKLESNVGWSVSFELAIKSHLNNLKITEFPIISINRFYGGSSSFRFWSWVTAYTKLFVWGLKSLHAHGKLRYQGLWKKSNIAGFKEVGDSQLMKPMLRSVR